MIDEAKCQSLDICDPQLHNSDVFWELYCATNDRQFDRLFNCVIRITPKKTSIFDLCFPHKVPVTRKAFPCHDDIMRYNRTSYMYIAATNQEIFTQTFFIVFILPTSLQFCKYIEEFLGNRRVGKTIKGGSLPLVAVLMDVSLAELPTGTFTGPIIWTVNTGNTQARWHYVTSRYCFSTS